MSSRSPVQFVSHSNSKRTDSSRCTSRNTLLQNKRKHCQSQPNKSRKRKAGQIINRNKLAYEKLKNNKISKVSQRNWMCILAMPV